jgi:hypothetical protein
MPGQTFYCLRCCNKGEIITEINAKKLTPEDKKGLVTLRLVVIVPLPVCAREDLWSEA